MFVVPFGTNNPDAVADQLDIGLSLLSVFDLLLKAGPHDRFTVLLPRETKKVR